MAKLKIQDVLGSERVIELDSQNLVIGRGGDADLVLNDKHASRLHARITREPGCYVITDLNSGNGLFVNDVRVQQKVLSDRDLIRVGASELLFEDSAETLAVRFTDTTPGVERAIVRRVEDAASPAGPAVDLEALRKKARILTLMYELGKTLKGYISLEELYRQVGNLLLEICAADRVLILERENSGDGLRLAHRSDPADADTDRHRTVSRTITRRVIEERVTILSSNAALDPAFAEGHSIVFQQLRSVICAPLLVRDEVKGVIYLDHGNVGAFTQEDLDVVNAIAAQAAIALENVHALELLTREAEARAAYSRFLPAHVVEDLLQDPQSAHLGGVNQIATVLFADIRGFTQYSALLPPQEVVAMLNEYFAEMTGIIFEHGGTLDKYIGDGIMALFGAPYPGPADATNAVLAAISMQKRLEMMREETGATEGPWRKLRVGVGINTGLVTVGYVGSARRLDYTAIGDTVNVAARLESNAPPGAIYISRSTYAILEGQFTCKPLRVKVKGKDEPLDCYEVIASG